MKEGYYRFERSYSKGFIYACPREKLCLQSSDDPSDDAFNCRWLPFLSHQDMNNNMLPDFDPQERIKGPRMCCVREKVVL